MAEQNNYEFNAEKEMLTDQFIELRDLCITDESTAMVEDDLLQVLDTYSNLYYKYRGHSISRARAYEDLRN